MPATPAGVGCRWPSTPWVATGPRVRSWPGPAGPPTELGIEVVLVGPPDQLGDTGDLEILPASEVIGMDEDPGQGVRRKKDSSLVRAAEAVRDGRALAMVSAGNTGATMASALLRMGRLKGIVRPAIATPIPQLGSHPTVLLDAGANSECTPAMLVQFAQMGAAYSTARYGVADPTVALLSIGEEKSKGTPLVKETHALLAATPGLHFVGNAEGRDLMHDAPDVVVTDGFTGNVALKTLEGSLRFFMDTLLEVLAKNEDDQEGVRGAPALPGPPGRRVRPRQHRRSRPARGGRDLRHQPRFLLGPGHRLGRQGGPRRGHGRPGRPPGPRRHRRLSAPIVGLDGPSGPDPTPVRPALWAPSRFGAWSVPSPGEGPEAGPRGKMGLRPGFPSVTGPPSGRMAANFSTPAGEQRAR